VIIIDTNIISTFCRVDQLSLLFRLFCKDKFGIVSAVYDELMEAIRLGDSFLEKVQSSIDSGELQLISLHPDELRAKQGLHRSFGSVDLASIIVCRERSYILLTNDKRVKNFCQKKVSLFMISHASARLM